MLLSVLDSASMLTRRLVKIFAIRTLVLSSVVVLVGPFDSPVCWATSGPTCQSGHPWCECKDCGEKGEKYRSVVWCECRECKERGWEGSTRPMVWCKDGVGTEFPPVRGKRAYTVIGTRVSSSWAPSRDSTSERKKRNTLNCSPPKEILWINIFCFAIKCFSNFQVFDHHALLVRWSLHKYKYLWGMRGKGQGSNLQESVSHTYTLRLG